MQMQEVPEDLLREDENGELRVIKNPARRTAARDLGVDETVLLLRVCILFQDPIRYRHAAALAARVHSLPGSLPPACPNK
jgi:hypothetical protein